MSTNPLKLIFMGSPAFALPCLQALIDSEHEVVAAYCQPPRPAGRGHKLRPTPVQTLAESHQIPIHSPKSLKSEEEQECFGAYEADAAIVVAYGLILPQPILDAPKRGCINVHPSALPRWRGAAPLQRTIMAGDSETSLCIMQMDAGLDTGDVLLEQPFSIPDGMTAGALHDEMAGCAGLAVLKVLANSPTPIPQNAEGVTYAEKISKAEAEINWNQPAHTVRQHILGLSPFPAAWSRYGTETIKILEGEIVPLQSAQPPGSIIDEALTIACSDYGFRPTLLQRSGKKAMNRDDFLRGFEMPAGSKFA
jgi:methionyl-tRNA formyltransferase